MANIESLKKEVDEIKNSLDGLKNNVTLSEVEKKNKADTLKIQVENTKHKIQDKIHSLGSKTDEESKKEREEAETLLTSFNETLNLYASILNSVNKKDKKQGDTKEKKGFFGKTGEWIGEQWKNLKENPGKYIFGVTGVLAVGYAIKKVWNWTFGDKEEVENDGEESGIKLDEKTQSFWKTGWGKFLKWTGISTVTGGGIYGVSKLLKGKKEEIEVIQEGGDVISDAMFQQLLHMEGNQDFVAKSHKQKFGENFVTGPYGMVYKHIDESGNLLKTSVSFKEGEHVSKDWAEKNARAYYNKKAKEWADLLKSKGYKYSQDMLDALVSASGGTKKSVDSLKNFVLTHWDDKDAIFNFMSKFATTAAGNGKTMPGLVIRRNFEANWFRGKKEPMSEYQRRYYA